MTMGWGAEPPSLDPGPCDRHDVVERASEHHGSAGRLNPDTLEAVPLAESWDVSSDGKTVTFHLRQDGKWTNGDPVTASDFVYSWKRTLSPELAADYAYQLYGIEGAQEYNACTKNCDALADKVGVSAPDDFTLVVKLTSPQPWFIQQASSFVPRREPVGGGAVRRQVDGAENIVTDGPFKLAKWEHDAEIDLVSGTSGADADVTSRACPARSSSTARRACRPSSRARSTRSTEPASGRIARLRRRVRVVSRAGYVLLRLQHQEHLRHSRAPRSVARREPAGDHRPDRPGGPDPGNGHVSGGHLGLRHDQSELAVDARCGRHRRGEGRAVAGRESEDGHQPVLQRLARPQGDRHCRPGAVEGARDQQQKQQEWAQYLEFLGPPPNNAVDVYRLGWIYDYPDAINGLDLWTCDSGNNNTNYCDKSFDDLVAQARETPDDTRHLRTAGGQAVRPGRRTADHADLLVHLPEPPKLSVKDTFNISPLDQFDLTKVVVKG